MATIIGAGYLNSCFDVTTLQKHINDTVNSLRPYADKFDSIAFRGMSGAVVAPAVAAQLGKHLIMVRKPHEQNHSGCSVEGFIQSDNYIIIDDFVDSGKTVKEIIKNIREWRERMQQLDWDWTVGDLNCIGGAFYLQEPDKAEMRKDNFYCAVENASLLYIPCFFKHGE